MKKIIVILLALAMIATAVPSVFAAYGTGQIRNDDTEAGPITTDVTVVGGGDPLPGDPPGGDPPVTDPQEPFIKHKWELVQELDSGGELIHQIDEDPDHDFLSVTLFPEGNRIIHYYLIVEEKTYNLARAYADIWHPDGKFKYQLELTKLNLEDGIAAWGHVSANYPEVLTSQTAETDAETLEELEQEEAFVYHGWAELSYCQPAGWYTVCARAVDSHGMWSTAVWNWFWYQPTASIALDFSSINYGTIGEEQWKWAGGNTVFDVNEDPSEPTIRNTGNVPLRLRFQQDDMNFGKTLVDGSLEWNVRFDARLGNAVDGDEVLFWPNVLSGWVDKLEMCTEEKLDFSIHIYKGVPGQSYTGELYIYAQTYKGDWGNGPYPVSPDAPDVGQLWYAGVAPDGVPVPPSWEPI